MLVGFKIYNLLYSYNYGYNYMFIQSANVAELVDALDLGSSRLSCESSSLSIRTTQFIFIELAIIVNFFNSFEPFTGVQ